MSAKETQPEKKDKKRKIARPQSYLKQHLFHSMLEYTLENVILVFYFLSISESFIIIL